jgi:hypothetical protein
VTADRAARQLDLDGRGLVEQPGEVDRMPRELDPDSVVGGLRGGDREANLRRAVGGDRDLAADRGLEIDPKLRCPQAARDDPGLAGECVGRGPGVRSVNAGAQRARREDEGAGDAIDRKTLCGVPETTSTCWIWAGKSPVFVTVNGRAPDEAPISTGPKARPWGFTEVIGPVSALALIGIVVGVEALSESITRLAEAGPDGPTGLKATPTLHELKALSSRPAQSP